MHTSNDMHTQKFVQGIDSSEQKFESTNLPQRPLCFKKKRLTTTIAFLIYNTLDLNPHSHSTTFNPQSFTPLILKSRFI